MDHKTTFLLANGSTRNIAEAPTKILGKLIAGSSSLTKQTVATKLDLKIISAMQRLDDRPFHGKFKVWIWKNYLAHPLRFMLMVDPVKQSVLGRVWRWWCLCLLELWLVENHWLAFLEGQRTSLLIHRVLREPDKPNHLEQSHVSMRNGPDLMLQDIHLGCELW